MSNTDAERWQRAKAYIDREIAAHQQALDAGGLDFNATYTRAVKRDVYEAILDRAEGK